MDCCGFGINLLVDVFLFIKCFNYIMLKIVFVSCILIVKINLCIVNSCRLKKKCENVCFWLNR